MHGLDTSAFLALSWPAAAFLVLSYILAFFIKGVFGYGAVPPILLAGSLLMPAHDAVLLAGLVNLASQTVLVPDGLRDGDRNLAFRLLAIALPLVILGVLLFQWLDTEGLKRAVGVALILLFVLEGRWLNDRLAPFAGERMGLFGSISAAVSGMISGVIGAGGMLFLSIYLRLRVRDALRFRGTVILFMSVMILWRTALLALAGLITMPLILGAAVLVPAAVFGSYVGRRVARQISVRGYFRAYKIFLIMSAALLIIQTLL